MNDENTELQNLMEECLERGFPLYNSDHTVQALPLPTDGGMWIGYRTNPRNIPQGTTHLDINLKGDTCFLVHIELDPSKRGQGFGRDLYRTVEDFAKLAGSRVVRMTPSGWTPSGKTRKDYLLGLGYVPLGKFEVEKELVCS